MAFRALKTQNDPFGSHLTPLDPWLNVLTRGWASWTTTNPM